MFTAAVTKGVNMPLILAGDGLLGTLPRLLFVIAFESAAATYLVIGSLWWSWLLTLVTFTIFVISSLYAMATDRSCSCFGEWLDVETVVVIDTVVLLLTVCLRHGYSRVAAGRLATHLLIGVIVGGSVVGLALLRHQSFRRTQRERLIVADVLLGNPWPINEQKHPALKPLSRGRWMIVIVNRDCKRCRTLIRKHFQDPELHRVGERTAVFAYGRDNPEWQFQIDRISLNPESETFFSWPAGRPLVASPAVFLINDGFVTDVAEGAMTDEFLGSLFSDAGRLPP